MLLSAGLWAPCVVAQEATLRGFITDRESGQSLQGANVVLQGTSRPYGAVTDKDGYYQITRVVPGEYVFQVSFVGYETFRDTLELGRDAFVTRTIALAPSEEVLEEVVVATEGGAARISAGLQTVRPSDLERIPTPDASGDLASYLQTLPGVVSLGDRGGQLFIRGGTPDQNLVLLDGMLVYQPLHIVGFFSAFPEDLISTVNVHAGGFGARYSGRISSVIDVAMREGNKQRFDANASLSPFLMGVRVEGPLKKGNVSALASVRSSIIDRVAPTLLRDPLPLRFGEQLIKLHGAPGENSVWSVTALHTYDRGRIDPESVEQGDVFRWNNVAVGARALAFPKEYPVLFEVNTGVSYVKNAVGDSDEPERFSDAMQLTTEVNVSTSSGPTEIDFGFFARANWFGYRLAEQFTNVRSNNDLLISSGAHGGIRVPAGEKWQFNPSLALVLYPFTFRPSLEPRVRVGWRPGGADGAQEINAAAGVYRQTVIGISDERDAGSVFVAWMPAPLDSTQVQAVHALLGWQGRFGRGLRLAAEGYYKRMGNLHVPIWSTIARFTTRLTHAEGRSYGVDARLEFGRGPFYLYVGYGYAWTEYMARQDNFGNWFGEPVQSYHPPHDRRHQLNTVVSLDVGRTQVNVRWQFGSGLPYTRPIGFDDFILIDGLVEIRRNPGITRVIYERPYAGRLPTYHRLDLSAERSFPVPFGRFSLQAGIINLYNRPNLFYYDVFTVRRVDQLPLLPYVSLLFETKR